MTQDPVTNDESDANHRARLQAVVQSLTDQGTLDGVSLDLAPDESDADRRARLHAVLKSMTDRGMLDSIPVDPASLLAAVLPVATAAAGAATAIVREKLRQ